jgi:hypothetical protein
LALLPYDSTPIGVSILAASVFVTSSNLWRVWWARALGETEYEAGMIDAASRRGRSTALEFVLITGANMAFSGLLLMWLSGSSTWVFWFGFGVVG